MEKNVCVLQIQQRNGIRFRWLRRSSHIRVGSKESDSAQEALREDGGLRFIGEHSQCLKTIFISYAFLSLSQISNAQTKEEYTETCLIPKNTSLIVARVPLSNQHKKSWEMAQNSTERAPQKPQSSDNANHDLSRMNGTEEDKIQVMMEQSTLDYDPTKLVSLSYRSHSRIVSLITLFTAKCFALDSERPGEGPTSFT